MIDPKKAVLYEHKQRVHAQPSQNTYKSTPPPTTNHRLRIGLDVDGVLYQFQKTALYMLNSMKGYDLKLEDWTYWNQPKDVVKNNDWQWLWTGGVKLGLFRYGHLYKGAIEGVRALNEIGDVIIITHRPRHAITDTLDWVAYLKLPITEVHVLSDGQPKSGVKADVYVDDKADNIADYLANTDGLPLLWSRFWNADAGFAERRVESWAEVIEIARQAARRSE